MPAVQHATRTTPEWVHARSIAADVVLLRGFSARLVVDRRGHAIRKIVGRPSLMTLRVGQAPVVRQRRLTGYVVEHMVMAASERRPGAFAILLRVSRTA